MSDDNTAASEGDALPTGYNLVGYEITGVLGAGGFGITYEAVNRVTERRMAIKEFYPLGLARRNRVSQVVYTQVDRGVIDWALERFRATTTLLARMNHPNVLSVHDYMPLNGTGYMIMEYVEGQTLQSLFERGSVSPQALRSMLVPILDALSYVHGQGLIHRDIAPDNIMITAPGRPVLIDFGAMSRDLSSATRAVNTRGIVKDGYTAPEQAVEDARPAPTADIYALGAVMYHGLTGRRPVSGSKRSSQVHLFGNPDPLAPLASLRLPTIAPEMAAAVDACLALYSRDRPQTIEALIERLGWPAARPAAAPDHHKRSSETDVERTPDERAMVRMPDPRPAVETRPAEATVDLVLKANQPPPAVDVSRRDDGLATADSRLTKALASSSAILAEDRTGAAKQTRPFFLLRPGVLVGVGVVIAAAGTGFYLLNRPSFDTVGTVGPWTVERYRASLFDRSCTAETESEPISFNVSVLSNTRDIVYLRFSVEDVTVDRILPSNSSKKYPGNVNLRKGTRTIIEGLDPEISIFDTMMVDYHIGNVKKSMDIDVQQLPAAYKMAKHACGF